MERKTRCAIKGNINNAINSQQKERKLLNMERAGNESDETENDEEEEMLSKQELRTGGKATSAGDGLCSICHLTVSSVNENDPHFEQTFSCTRGHVLCHRCVHNFAIRTDIECVLCSTESAHFNDSSQEMDGPRTRTDRVYETSRQEQCPYVNCEGTHADPWTGNYSTPVFPGENHKATTQGQSESSSKREVDEAEAQDEGISRQDSRQHQQRSYCSIIRKESLERRSSETKINGQSISDCSRRPIRCPRIDCAVNVAFSALTHHFLFDHPEVPILSLEPGSKSTLIVSFSALSCDSSRCLALLLVSDRLSGPAARLFNGSQVHPKYRNRLPLPVLAARLHCTDRYSGHDKVHAGGEGNCKGDVIIAWVAGLDIGNTTNVLRCTIQAVDNVDNEGFRSLTYTGPVNSLRTAQRPQEVFESGDCVVLHEGLIRHMTSGCPNLNINIIIH